MAGIIAEMKAVYISPSGGYVVFTGGMGFLKLKYQKSGLIVDLFSYFRPALMKR